MAYLVEFHAITKILLTLREITKKITKNFQLPKKSEKSRNITKSGCERLCCLHISIQKHKGNSIRMVKNANFTKLVYLMDVLGLKFCKPMVSVLYNMYCCFISNFFC